MQKVIITILILSSMTMAQTGRIAEAKAKNAAQHHKAMVEKAQRLLKEKESLEAYLKVVEAELAKIDSGEDQQEESAAATTILSGAAYGTYGTIGTSCNCIVASPR